MAALSNSAEVLLMNHLMGGAASVAPTSRHIALFTTDPTDDGSGTELADGVDGYSRQVATFTAAVSPGGTSENVGGVSFTASGGNFGNITHMAIFDAATVGNMLWHGQLSVARVINDGDTLTFAAGNIDLTLA